MRRSRRMSSLGDGSSDPDADLGDDDGFALFSDVEDVEVQAELSVSSDDSDNEAAVVIAPTMSSGWFSRRNAAGVGVSAYGYNPFAEETVMDLHEYVSAATTMARRGQSGSGLVPYDEASGDEPMPLPLPSWALLMSSSDNLDLNRSTMVDETDERPRDLPDNLKYCAFCKQPGDLLCSCYRVVYCSAEHQEQDWCNHQVPCTNFSLRRSAVVRYQGPFEVTQDMKSVEKPSFWLKAPVTVPAQEKLFEETPILVCPWARSPLRQCEDFTTQPFKQLTLLSCFGCGHQLGLGDDIHICCTKCNLPLCSENCPGIRTHKLNECEVIKKYQHHIGKGWEKPEVTKMLKMGIDEIEFVYEDVMMVRLIKHFMGIEEKQFGKSPGDTLQRNGFNNMEWVRLMNVWKFDETKRVESIRGQVVRKHMEKVFGFSFYLTGGDYSLVWRLFCILESNSFSFHLPYKRFKVLCTLLPLVKNGCYPNAHAFLVDAASEDEYASPEPEFLIRVISGRTIQKGTSITFSYTPVIFCTLERRLILLDKHCFWCECKRCTSPSELQNYIGSFSCNECRVMKSLHSFKIPSMELLQRGPEPCPESITTQDLVLADLEHKRLLSSDEYNWTCTEPPAIISHKLPHCNMLQQFYRHEMDGVQALGDFSRAFTLFHQKFGAVHGNHTILLKLCEDILRGDFFKHPKSQELGGFEAMNVIQAAKVTFTGIMRALNPAFGFQGYPMDRIKLCESDSGERGRDLHRRSHLSIMGLTRGTAANRARYQSFRVQMPGRLNIQPPTPAAIP